jgi:hypothetical protein
MDTDKSQKTNPRVEKKELMGKRLSLLAITILAIEDGAESENRLWSASYWCSSICG